MPPTTVYVTIWQRYILAVDPTRPQHHQLLQPWGECEHSWKDISQFSRWGEPPSGGVLMVSLELAIWVDAFQGKGYNLSVCLKSMWFFLGAIPDSDSFQQKWSASGNFLSSSLTGELVMVVGWFFLLSRWETTKTNPESSNVFFVRCHLRRCHLFQLSSNFRPHKHDTINLGWLSPTLLYLPL